MIATQISSDAEALNAVEAEIDKIDLQIILLNERRQALQKTAHKILSEIATVSNVYGGSRYGIYAGIRGQRDVGQTRQGRP